jgi:hypothetical protein
MVVAIVLFALAALGGLVLALRRAKNLPLPAGLAVGHGLAAAAGLVTLLLTVLSGAPSLADIALVLLVGAALGGFVTASFHVRGKKIPMPLVVVHACVAVGGFLLLVVAALGT